jgi:hypothetical protein
MLKPDKVKEILNKIQSILGFDLAMGTPRQRKIGQIIDVLTTESKQGVMFRLGSYKKVQTYFEKRNRLEDLMLFESLFNIKMNEPIRQSLLLNEENSLPTRKGLETMVNSIYDLISQLELTLPIRHMLSQTVIEAALSKTFERNKNSRVGNSEFMEFLSILMSSIFDYGPRLCIEFGELIYSAYPEFLEHPSRAKNISCSKLDDPAFFHRIRAIGHSARKFN